MSDFFNEPDPARDEEQRPTPEQPPAAPPGDSDAPPLTPPPPPLVPPAPPLTPAPPPPLVPPAPPVTPPQDPAPSWPAPPAVTPPESPGTVWPAAPTPAPPPDDPFPAWPPSAPADPYGDRAHPPTLDDFDPFLPDDRDDLDDEPGHRSHNPLDRATRGLPHAWRVGIDWFVTIVGAVLIVLAIKAWVVNPYRIPTPSMEPTLHCARSVAEPSCRGRFSDRVLANRFIYHFRSPNRGEIVVFHAPPAAATKCTSGEGNVFVKRIIGKPGDVISERNGWIYINGKRLEEPYLRPSVHVDDAHSTFHGPITVPKGDYYMMGDNRSESCDSRTWGPVPRKSLIGKVFMTYWPPNRISIH
jgi:signal peptidase I